MLKKVSRIIRTKKYISFGTLKKIIFTLILFLTALFIEPLWSQWAIRYDRGFTGPSGHVQHTNEGGYIFPCGGTIVKLSSAGHIEWQYSYRGLQSSSIYATNEGGYIVAGETHGQYGKTDDLIVIKLSEWGEIEWQKSYRTSDIFFNERPNSIQQTNDGGFIVAGYLVEYGPWDSDRNIFILKLTPTGEVEWHKVHDYGGLDIAYSIQQTSDGGYIATGYAGAIRHEERLDMWISKLTSQGETEWQKLYGGNGREGAYSVQQTNEGGFIVAGYETSFPGRVGALVMKLFPNGDIEWQKSFRRDVPMYANFVSQTYDGGYVIAGQGAGWDEETDLWYFKLSSDGKIEWRKTFDNEKKGAAYCIKPVNDGGYIVYAGIEDKEWWVDHFLPVDRPLVLRLTSFGEVDGSCDLIKDLDITILETSIIPHEELLSTWTESFIAEEQDVSQEAADGRFVLLCGEADILSLFPPLNFSGEKVLNRALFVMEYVNVLTWEDNPENERILKYKIYQLKNGSRTLIAEIDSHVSLYWHRNVHKDEEYKYTIAAVDNQNRESYPAFTIVQ